MPSWNEWYNPLDNIANVAKGFGRTLTGGMYGGSASDPTGGYNTANNTTQQSYNRALNIQPESTNGWTGATTNYAPGVSTNSPLNSSTSGDGGGGSTATAYDANELRAIDQQKSLYQRLLESADSTLNSGLNSLNDSFNLNRNRANEDRTTALGRYNQQRQQTDEGRERSLNQVGDNSRVARNSLMRILGLASGGGSAFDMADQAVAREATKNRSGVLEDYKENVTNLGMAEDDAKTQFQRLLDDLTNQKREREQSLRSGVASQKLSLVDMLGQIDADRARLMGGDQFAAAQPWRNQFSSLQDTIDNLPNQFRTAVDYKKPNFQNVSLRDYVVNRSNIGAQAPGRQEQYSPYSNFLRPQGRDEGEQRLA